MVDVSLVRHDVEKMLHRHLHLSEELGCVERFVGLLSLAMKFGDLSPPRLELVEAHSRETLDLVWMHIVEAHCQNLRRVSRDILGKLSIDHEASTRCRQIDDEPGRLGVADDARTIAQHLRRSPEAVAFDLHVRMSELALDRRGPRWRNLELLDVLVVVVHEKHVARYILCRRGVLRPPNDSFPRSKPLRAFSEDE